MKVVLNLKKFIFSGLTAAIVLSIGMPATLASKYIPTTDDNEVKSIEVPLEDVLDTSLYAINPTNTSVLSKDFATSAGQTGKVTSIGQYIDLTKVIPAKSKVVSITIYCPSDIKVTQSQFTTIDNYLISYDGSTSTAVKFQKTNNPTSTSKTTFFKDKDANVRWFVQLEGTILKQHTGMDGFTVFGSKMIIEYK